MFKGSVWTIHPSWPSKSPAEMATRPLHPSQAGILGVNPTPALTVARGGRSLWGIYLCWLDLVVSTQQWSRCGNDGCIYWTHVQLLLQPGEQCLLFILNPVNNSIQMGIMKLHHFSLWWCYGSIQGPRSGWVSIVLGTAQTYTERHSLPYKSDQMGHGSKNLT